MTGTEFRIVWQREDGRTRYEYRQTLAGAQAKADRLRGDFMVATDDGGCLSGDEWYAEQGHPPLAWLEIHVRLVGDWETHSTGPRRASA